VSRARFAFVLSGCLIALAGDARGDDVRIVRPSRFSVGVYGGSAVFSEEIALGSPEEGAGGSGFMVGARAGVTLGDWTADGGTFGDTVGVELEAGRTERVLGWGVNAVIGHLSDRPVHPFTTFGIGAARLVDEDDSAFAVRAGMGLHLRAGPGAIRIDARIAALPGRDDDVAAAGELQLGYSIRFGGGGTRIGRVQLAGRGAALPPPIFLVVAPAPPPRAPLAPAPPPAFTGAETPRPGAAPDAGRDGPPLVWSERARLPDDAPPPVWIVSAAR
jgi:hypothetical protein